MKTLRKVLEETKIKTEWKRSYSKTAHGCPVDCAIEVDIYECPLCKQETERDYCASCSKEALIAQAEELFKDTPPIQIFNVMEGLKIKDDIEFFSNIWIKDGRIWISNEDREREVKLTQILFEDYDFMYADCPIVGMHGITFNELLSMYFDSKKD